MGTIFTLWKIAQAIFPFLSELFLLNSGKKKPRDPPSPLTVPEHLRPQVRKVVLIVGLFATLACVFLAKRVYELSTQVTELRAEQIAEEVRLDQVAQRPPVVIDPTPGAAPAPEAPASAPPHMVASPASTPTSPKDRPKKPKPPVLYKKKQEDDLEAKLTQIQKTYQH